MDDSLQLPSSCWQPPLKGRHRASRFRHRWYAQRGKRAIDLLLTVPGVVLLAPGLIALGLLVRWDSDGPVLYAGERLGVDGNPFRQFKFRTMVHRPRIEDRQVFDENPEITRVGRWLRRFKLDELPQVVNVLQGEMTLVGPRPDLPIRLRQYTEDDRKRLVVRPGLTGLAQIRGNIHLTFPQRWFYDVQYVETLSPGLDAWILWRTVRVMLQGEQRFLNLPRVLLNEAGEVRDPGTSASGTSCFTSFSSGSSETPTSEPNVRNDFA